MNTDKLTFIFNKPMRYLFILLLSAGDLMSLGQGVAQWRGPQRSGLYPDTALLTLWPENGPDKIWSVNGIGKGYSSPSVTEDAIFLTGLKDTTDYLMKISLKGEILWEVPVGRSWTGTFPDSRSTPTVEDDRVYVLSGTGRVSCINANDGSLIWMTEAAGKFDARWGDWGICESLLVSGDKLIYTPAGPRTTMVALDKMTGSTVWESPSLDDTSAYVSPLLLTAGGKELIITTIARHLIGIYASTGRIAWSYDYASLLAEESLKIWPGAPFTNTITPLVKGNRIYITGGYNHVGAMFELSGDASDVSLVWTDTLLDCHHGGVVLVDGYIFGSNWINNAYGNWCCIEWNTGKPAWDEKWFGKGSVITDGEMLYILDEMKGNMGLVRADPAKFDLVSSFRISEGTGPFWAHPVICGGNLYIRHGDTLLAFSIRESDSSM